MGEIEILTEEVRLLGKRLTDYNPKKIPSKLLKKITKNIKARAERIEQMGY